MSGGVAAAVAATVARSVGRGPVVSGLADRIDCRRGAAIVRSLLLRFAEFLRLFIVEFVRTSAGYYVC